MRVRFLLLVAACLLLTMPSWAITLTGNVDNDFVGPGVYSFNDDIPAGAGCEDEPLGPNSFVVPPPDPPPSGFNLSRVALFYDCENDDLYVGMDICDTEVPWDADGDGDPLVATTPGLQITFSDRASEDYVLSIDVGAPGPDLVVEIRSSDGNPSTVTSNITVNPGGVTLHDVTIGSDVEFRIHGLRAAFPTYTALPIETRSGSLGDVADEDVTQQVVPIPCPCVEVKKWVSCSPDGPWASTAQVLRGADAYFKIRVENCGNEDLRDVVVTDVLTPGYTGIPDTIVIGDLPVGGYWEQVYTVPTPAGFNVVGVNPDIVNTASVSGVGKTSGGRATDPVEPDSTATVNILVPSITCEKSAGTTDTGPFVTGTLDLRGDGSNDVETVYFKLCVTNNGEVDVDFTQGCTDHFVDGTLEDTSPPAGISGPPFDIDAMFMATPELADGVLNVGETACIIVGPVLLDESVLCPEGTNLLINTFQACGFATEEDICLPAAGGEDVSTGSCIMHVQLCNVPGATRTPGFWMTHARALQYAINRMYEETGGAGYTLVNLYQTFTWPDLCAVIGDTQIPNINGPSCEGKLAWQLLKATPGSQPTPNLHVAAILEFQLIAGICNEVALGAGGIVVDGMTLSELVDAGLALTQDCVIDDMEIHDALMIAEKLDIANNDPIAHQNPLPPEVPKFKAEPKFFTKYSCP